MLKIIASLLVFSLAFNVASAQPTREELEKQRQQIKKEIEETQKQLHSVQDMTKSSLSKFFVISTKEKYQERLVDISAKDIHILDDNIYLIQRDINRYDKLLDTLKQEYAKSMVYSYKNRGNYEFMNFIFSADNFNDAVKRVAYLKSYRNYRELQGENILRTQELRRKRLEDLGVSKEKKQSALQVQSKEADELADQKAEQDKIVADLKRQGKDLNARIAARQKDMARVKSAVNAVIAKAIADEKKRKEAMIAANAAANAAAANNATASGSKPAAGVKATRPVSGSKPVITPENKILNDENTASAALSASFEKNYGSLPWPVDNGAVLMHFGPNILPGSTTHINNPCITISSPVGSAVKAVFDGVVILVKEIDDGKYIVTLKHGNFYTTYSNLSNVSVRMDEEVKTGQALGKVALNFDGIGTMDFYTAQGLSDKDPEKWLRRR